MDKNSLSEYGWIIIIVIILSILIAFAAPFSNFVVTSIVGMTESFSNTFQRPVDAPENVQIKGYDLSFDVAKNADQYKISVGNAEEFIAESVDVPIDLTEILATQPGIVKISVTASDSTGQRKDSAPVSITYKQPGLYETGTNNLLKMWSSLVSEGILSADGVIQPGKESELAGDIVIINTLSEIVKKSFADCTALTGAEIPRGTLTVGSYAFDNCAAMTGITISNTVEELQSSAFMDCQTLANVDFEADSKLKSIGINAFLRCNSLESIEIPKSVVIIDSSAFSYCDKLKNVTFEQKSNLKIASFRAFEYCKSLVQIRFPDGLLVLEDDVLWGCESLTTVTVPQSLVYVGNSLFQYCTTMTYNTYDNGLYVGNANNPYVLFVKAKETSITSCNIHPDTKIICHEAFAGCISLTALTLPNKVECIGEAAFKNCSSLTNLVIPSTVNQVYLYAFDGCTSLNYTTYDNALYLGNDSNPYHMLVKAINKNIVSCDIHDNTKLIACMAFLECTKLESVAIPDVIYIGEQALYCCDNLASITFENSTGNMTKIHYFTFGYTNKLETFAFPEGVVHIDEYALEACPALTTVTIPASVTWIGTCAMYDCPNLTTINYGGTIGQWKRITFDEYWDSYSGEYTVYCTDGTTTKDGTVVYY